MHRKCVYDSTKIHFSFDMFITQLVIHLFYPFSLRLSPNFMTQGFRHSDPVNFFVNHVQSVCFITMILAYWMSPDSLEGAVYTPAAAYMLHKLMVSLKYASMSQSEYNRFMALTMSDYEIKMNYANQLQIIQGLLGNEHNVLLFEVAASATRIRIDLSGIQLVVPIRSNAQIEQWLKFTNKAVDHVEESKIKTEMAAFLGNFAVDKDTTGIVNKKEDGTTNGLKDDSALDNLSPLAKSIPIQLLRSAYEGGRMHGVQSIRVPCSILSMSLLQSPDGSSAYADKMQIFCCAIIALHAVVPFVFSPVGSSMWSVMFYVTSTIISCFFLWVLLIFLQGALFYVHRQYAIATKMADMIKPMVPLVRNEAYVNNDYSDSSPLIGTEHNLRTDQTAVTAPVSMATSKVVPSTLDDCDIRPFDLDTKDVEATKPITAARVATLSHRSYAKAQLHELDHMSDGENEQPDYIFPTAKTAHVPYVPTNCPKNVLGWLYCRSLLQNFGLRFRFRLDTYMGTLFVIGFGLGFATMTVLANSPDPAATLGSVLFIQTQLVMALVSVTLLIIILTGAKANIAFDYHRDVLSNLIVDVRMRMTEMVDEVAEMKSQCCIECQNVPLEDKANSQDYWASKIESLESELSGFSEAAEALSSGMDMVSTGNEQRPLSILGYPCSTALAYTLFTTLIGYFLYLASWGASP